MHVSKCIIILCCHSFWLMDTWKFTVNSVKCSEVSVFLNHNYMKIWISHFILPLKARFEPSELCRQFGMLRKQKSKSSLNTDFLKYISIFFKPSHDFLMLQIGQFGCKGILQKFKRVMACYEKDVNTQLSLCQSMICRSY